MSGDNLFVFLGLPRLSALFSRCVISKHYWTSALKAPQVEKRVLRESKPFVVPRVYTKYGKRLRSFYVPEFFNNMSDTFFFK